MLAQLKQAAEPKPLDPTLPLKLAMAKEQIDAQLHGLDDDWWEDARSSGDLVLAGLNAITRWLARG